ncbi:putative transcription factor/ chromatin remodeling BED-type(Zn) family [Helianthus annuus]|nr:putative transcription factor/ chromatin remodeling BED-type(Zn) family [Helianthus annuus]
MDMGREEFVGCDDANTQTNVDSNQHMEEDQQTKTNQSQNQDKQTHEDAEEPRVRKRKLTSVAWEHFTKMMVNGAEKVECKYCNTRLGAKSSNGTKHLLSHMEICKKRKNKDIRQQVLSVNEKKTSGHSDISCYNFDGDKSRRDLAEMAIVHGYPLSMVEHHGFRKFVRGLQPFFKVPSRNTLKSDVLKIFEYEKKKTMRILEKNPSRIKYSFPKFYGSKEGAEAEVEKHKKFIYELFEDYKTTGYENVRNHESSRPTSNNDKSQSGLFDDYSSYVAEENTSGGILLELDHYLEEKVCPPDMDLDILAWWKTNGLKYPMLQRIARDVLAIPITTVASESSFSTSGRLVSPHRSRLHPSTLEALMCAQSWLLNEIRATCSKETEAYCQTIEQDYDDSDEENNLKE